jgi:hypothetical protein
MGTRTTTRTTAQATDGLHLRTGSGYHVENVRVFNVSGAGIHTANSCDDVTYLYCTVDQSFADALRMYNGITNGLIQYCNVKNNGDDMLACIGESGSPNGFIDLLDNLLEGNWNGGLGVEGASDVNVKRNRIFGTYGAGIRIACNAAYTAGPVARVAVHDNWLENVKRRQDTTHGAIMMFTSDTETMTDIEFLRNTIKNPQSTMAVKAERTNGAISFSIGDTVMISDAGKSLMTNEYTSIGAAGGTTTDLGGNTYNGTPFVFS